MTTDTDPRVLYMLHRTAGLIATDSRTGILLGEAWVSAEPLGDDSATFVPYVPLLLVLNLSRHWSRFRTGVLQPLVRLATEARKPRLVPDWSRTFEAFAQGDGELKHKRRPRPHLVHPETSWPLTFVAREVGQHVDALGEFVSRAFAAQPRITSLRAQLEKMREAVGPSSDGSEPFARLGDDHEACLDHLRRAFAAVLEAPAEHVAHRFAEYLATEPPGLDTCRVHPAWSWREDYLRLNTGLRSGSDLLVRGGTDAAHLFELWCFHEVLNRLRQREGVRAIQRRGLSGKQNQEVFHVAGVGNVAYNYTGTGDDGDSEQGELGLSKILQNTCVEWFLRRTSGAALVFDTKFKEWQSRDNLTVLGYLRDFDADTAVVVFSGPIPRHKYKTPTISEDGFVVVRGSDGKTFCAMSLVPDAAARGDNDRVLDRFIDEVVLHTPRS